MLLYPQRATVGVDIKFPMHETVRGLVTVHHTTRFEDLVQAIFRLRYVNVMHHMDFVAICTCENAPGSGCTTRCMSALLTSRVDVLRSAWPNSEYYRAADSSG